MQNERGARSILRQYAHNDFIKTFPWVIASGERLFPEWFTRSARCGRPARECILADKKCSTSGNIFIYVHNNKHEKGAGICFATRPAINLIYPQLQSDNIARCCCALLVRRRECILLLPTFFVSTCCMHNIEITNTLTRAPLQLRLNCKLSASLLTMQKKNTFLCALTIAAKLTCLRNLFLAWCGAKTRWGESNPCRVNYVAREQSTGGIILFCATEIVHFIVRPETSRIGAS